MAQDFARPFYASQAWQECREGYIKSVFGLCEICREPGYIVHHKTKLTPGNIGDPYITLGWDNLQYLCLNCHNSVHGDGGVTRDGLQFDAQGGLVRVPPGVRGGGRLL
jgi:5-methylcytosine-specific restriction endonuclease McrA